MPDSSGPTDVLLLSPPVGNFAQVHPAICLLTRYLREAGLRVTQKDLAIACFNHYHSGHYLRSLQRVVHDEIERIVSGRTITTGQAEAVSERIRLCLLLDRAGRAVDDAKERLRDAAILDDPHELAEALGVLKGIGRAITAAHPGQQFNFQKFRVTGAFDSWDRLLRVLDSPEENLLLPFLESLPLPAASLLGLSVTYPDQFLPALCIARTWRRNNPDGQVIIGGSYVTRMEESFRADPRWFDLFDYLVVGDGEEALLALANEGGRPAAPELIPNLRFRAGGEVHQSRVKARTNLNRIPVPMLDFDGIDLSEYVVPYPVVALPISRGCYWGKCTFCNISNQTEEPYRVRDVTNVVKDIDALRQVVGTPYFDFCVDSYHPSGLAKLSQALIDAGINIRWNAELLLDPKFDRETLGVMAKSGCRHLRFGLESVNQSTLSVMNKRNDLAVVGRILKDCTGSDIKVSLMSIIGFPTETEEEAWNTVNYYLENASAISFVTLHQFNVSAGSPIAQNPDLCNIELRRLPGILQPRFSYVNKNEAGMTPERVSEVLPRMEEAIRQKYPQHAEIHTVGIGGWLTFLACCRHDSTYFKHTVNPSVVPAWLSGGSWSGVDRRALKALGAFQVFEIDVAIVEQAARRQSGCDVSRSPSCVLLSADGERIHILPPVCQHDLRNAYDGSLDEVSDKMFRILSSLGLIGFAGDPRDASSPRPLPDLDGDPGPVQGQGSPDLSINSVR